MTQKQQLIFYGVKFFPSRGGTSRVAENLIRNLHTEFDIRIYCYRHKDAADHVPGVETVQFPELPFGSAGVFVYYLLSALHLLLFADRKAAIHAHKTDCSFFLPLLRLKFKNITATSHEAPYHRDKWNAPAKAYFRLMEWVFIYSGVKLTSISKPLADYYEEKYKRRVLFVPNGMNTDNDVDTAGAQKILDDRQISEGYFMFSARRIMATKGLHTMLEALHLLKSKKPVLIVGDTDHAQSYVDELKKKYGHLNLHFTGFIDFPQLLGLIGLSELFIFPSEIEGMSIMLMEVMAVGTPIVCSDIPENLQAFTRDEALYFKNKDAGDLKQKIGYALEHRKEMNALSAKARKKIQGKYLWVNLSIEYRTIYLSQKSTK